MTRDKLYKHSDGVYSELNQREPHPEVVVSLRKKVTFVT